MQEIISHDGKSFTKSKEITGYYCKQITRISLYDEFKLPRVLCFDWNGKNFKFFVNDEFKAKILQIAKMINLDFDVYFPDVLKCKIDKNFISNLSSDFFIHQFMCEPSVKLSFCLIPGNDCYHVKLEFVNINKTL